MEILQIPDKIIEFYRQYRIVDPAEERFKTRIQFLNVVIEF